MCHRTDYHPLLRIYTKVLRYLGLWKIERNYSPFVIYAYLLYKFIVISMICIFIAALTADLFMCTDDLLIMTDDGCILAGIFVILFKLINFQIHLDELEGMITFVDVNIDALHRDGNPEYLKILKRYALRERLTIYCFGTIGMFLIFALMFFSPTESGALPIRSEYFFDITESPIHQLMFVYQGIVLTISMFSILSMDNMILIFLNQIFCHFEVLKIKFGKCLIPEENKIFDQILPADQIQPSKKISKHIFQKNLSKCIKRHQDIIQFVQNLDKFFSPLMFVQLMASNVLICLTGFQAILVVGQNSGFMKFAIYLSAAFSQLFYWCWFGNELIYQSTSVAEALWLCPWELVEMSSIKSLITIPLMRAKKPLKLTAGKFYVMSMEAFISVLSGSYSYFTLLNKMNESGD